VEVGSNLSALNRFADSQYMGQSDIDGNNGNFRFKGNQELTREE
jgi:hypothetical protein